MRLSILGKVGHVVSWLCFVSIAIGLLVTLQNTHQESSVSIPVTCERWKSSRQLTRACAHEIVDSIPTKELQLFLSLLVPDEMMNSPSSGTGDWVALVLFSKLEYSIVRRCMFDGLEHEYCDASKREEVHQLVDRSLMDLLLSEDEDVQLRAMILACGRSKVGRVLRIPEHITKKEKSMLLYTQLCSSQDRNTKIEEVLNESNELRSMALLSFLRDSEVDISLKGKDWTPLEKSIVQAISQGEQK